MSPGEPLTVEAFNRTLEQELCGWNAFVWRTGSVTIVRRVRSAEFKGAEETRLQLTLQAG